MTIRTTETDDVPALQNVLTQTGLFPPELLPEMLENTTGTPNAVWLSCLNNGHSVGFCHATAEEMTNGTWNMLAIAVDPAVQGAGHGTALVNALEEQLRATGQRILIVDTSGSETFAETRAFYANRGYCEEARIRDFWDVGDDKVTFRKQL